MKYIVRILVSAFAFISAAACYNNEIENPDNPQNPGQSGLRITATMAKTRVNYGNETDAQLLPVWEEGDILFGFYGDDPDDNGIVLMVSGVNEGVAELEIVSGELANQNVETSVCLIYTGCNEEDLSGEIDPDEFKFSEGGTFTVDLTSQNLDHIPVCMSATATIGGNDAAKTLSFNFAYDCAVLEIQSLRGFKEDKSATSISKIEVTDLVLGGTYKYDRLDGFRFEPNTSTATYSVPVDPDKWDVNADGKLVYEGNPKGFLIAAAPNSTSKEIKVKVYNSASSETPYFVHPCNSTTISAGRCYVVRSEEVVAKTIDGLYFTTVKAAFDRAAEIADELKIDPTLYDGNNIVTLVKEEIVGLNEDIPNDGEVEYDPTIIEIGYSVTLELNGCTLDLDYWEEDSYDRGGFKVTENGSLIVKDEIGSGCIQSVSYCPIIENHGTVDILGGEFKYWENDDPTSPLIKNINTLNVSGGSLYCNFGSAIESSGEQASVTISGGVIGNGGDSYEAIQIYGGAQCTISGGVIFSERSSTIFCGSVNTGDDASVASALTITWPKINGTLNQGYGEEIHQPLIYSKSSEFYLLAPITTFYRDEVGITRVNTAQVLIQGGYLFTHNSEGIIYIDDDVDTDDFTNLIFSSCGNFYANAYVIDIYANSYNKNYFKNLYPSYTYGTKTLSATSKTVYSPDFLKEYFKDEYEDYPVETSLWYFK